MPLVEIDAHSRPSPKISYLLSMFPASSGQTFHGLQGHGPFSDFEPHPCLGLNHPGIRSQHQLWQRHPIQFKSFRHMWIQKCTRHFLQMVKDERWKRGPISWHSNYPPRNLHKSASQFLHWNFLPIPSKMGACDMGCRPSFSIISLRTWHLLSSWAWHSATCPTFSIKIQ